MKKTSSIHQKNKSSSPSILKKIGAHVFASTLTPLEFKYLWKGEKFSDLYLKTLGIITISLIVILIIYLVCSTINYY